MIPYGLVAGKLMCQEEIDFRILDMSTEHFTMRLAKSVSIDNIKGLTLFFYDRKKAFYNTISINDYKISQEGSEAYYTVYRVDVADESYSLSASLLMKDYSDYIELKLNEDDDTVSYKLLGYPTKLEYDEGIDAYKKRLFGNISKELSLPYKVEVALCLNNKNMQEIFQKCSVDEFEEQYWRLCYMNSPIISGVTHVYVGSQVCMCLMPRVSELVDIIEKAQKQDIEPVLVLPPVKEHEIKHVKELLDIYKGLCGGGEVVVNDLGICAIIRDEYQGLNITAGILLNKCRKDSRLRYLNQKSEHMDISYLSGMNVSYESTGTGALIPSGGILHIPFYQTNTATFCTLYASKMHHDRGMQGCVDSCPRYCEKVAYMYPKHLNQIGLYNSIWGYDGKILTDNQYLNHVLTNEIKRIVVDLPSGVRD